MTRLLVRRDLESPPEVPGASSLSTDIGDRFEARNAGMIPAATAVKTDTSTVTRRTAESTSPLRVRGKVVGGRNAERVEAVQEVSARAIAPPARAIRRFS